MRSYLEYRCESSLTRSLQLTITERDVTFAELQRFGHERDVEARRNGTALLDPTRVGVVALDDTGYVGCGIVDVFVHEGHARWAFLAELFVEKPLRKRGLGRALLAAVEHRAASAGAHSVWTRTAGYEAPGFYLHHGYVVTHDLPHWYRSGHGNVVLRKSLVGLPPLRPLLDPTIRLHHRMATTAELARTAAGFVEHAEDFGNPRDQDERIGFVATDSDGPIGYVSGLIRRAADGVPSHWCTLTDLFVTDRARKNGVGAALLDAMHAKLIALGCGAVETWTPAFHGVDFMLKRGYEVSTELEDWYPGGLARVALRATLPKT